MEQREELEIETRLRAALAARSELVTHSTLRPGVPPNEHTAGVKNKGAGWWSWRRFLVPVTVAAALAGGVFVGAQLPDDKGKSDVSAGSGGTPGGASTDASSYGAKGSAATSTSAPTPQATESSAADGTSATEASVATLHFVVADGWQLTAIDDTSACVTPKAKTSGGGSTPTGGDAAAKPVLPCGVDALYLKSDAAPNAWPLSTATKDSGWWPKSVAQVSDIACPAAKPGSGDQVQSSELLRSSAKYQLGAGAPGGAVTIAEYHEWAVTCDTGSGARPMLWQLKPAGDAKSAVAAVVSVDPAYDSALLGMVGSLHLAS